MEARVASGSGAPALGMAPAPASCGSQAISAPVASTACTAASTTSGPMPSPRMSVTLVGMCGRDYRRARAGARESANVSGSVCPRWEIGDVCPRRSLWIQHARPAPPRARFHADAFAVSLAIFANLLGAPAPPGRRRAGGRFGPVARLWRGILRVVAAAAAAGAGSGGPGAAAGPGGSGGGPAAAAARAWREPTRPTRARPTPGLDPKRPAGRRGGGDWVAERRRRAPARATWPLPATAR